MYRFALVHMITYLSGLAELLLITVLLRRCSGVLLAVVVSSLDGVVVVATDILQTILSCSLLLF